MMQLALALFLVVFGVHRFVQAARSGVLTGPKLGANRRDQPARFAANMTILGCAVLMSVWLAATSLASIHVAVHASH